MRFYAAPRAGDVYNIGGGRANSLSILETIAALAERGFRLDHGYDDRARTGDHICYISDLSKLRAHFPQGTLQYDVPAILDEIEAHYAGART